jgi:protein-S-isoprenylcysteine O-methyltransferase Ste14
MPLMTARTGSIAFYNTALMTDARPGVLGRLVVVMGGLAFVASLLGFAWTYRTGGRLGAFAGPWRAGEAIMPVAADIALFSVFALHHSLLARTGWRNRVSAIVSPPYERAAYVWIASLLFAAVYLWWQPVAGRLWRVEGTIATTLSVVQAIGMILTVAGARRLGLLDLAGIRQGFGLESSGPATLVSDGLYGFVRHPVYFAWLLVVWPAPDMTGTRLVFAAISTLYLALAIPHEERGLIRLFGSDYRKYQQQVRWRMIPYVY